MKRPFRYTVEARRDLLTIWAFIGGDDIQAADRLVQKVDLACRLLAKQPLLRHRRPEIQTRKPVLFWPVNSYVIVYIPEPRPITIVRVLHGARDLNALL